MITYTRKAGSVDVSVVIRIIDSTDGTPETGVVFNTSGLDLQYRREGAASVAITEATLAALTTAHADGGFLHIGNGYYRLDLPDAAVAAGADGVLVHGACTGMVVIGAYVHLTSGGIRKNQALANFPFTLIDSGTNLPATGKTVTVARSLDGGATFTTVGPATEMANGWYQIDLAASDMNADTVALRMTASGCYDKNIALITEP